MAFNINKEGAAYVHSFLLAQGFTSAGAYGMMANIYAESNFYPNNLQNTYNKKLGMSDAEYTERVDTGTYSKQQFVRDSAGYGLCQWTYWTRKQGLYEYIESVGASIGDIHHQLLYLMQELERGYADLLGALRKADDAEACAKLVMTRFERPADQSEAAQNRRAGYAKEIRALFEHDSTDPVKVMKIVIDAGHGLKTAGKRCMKALDINETREWVLNSRIANYVVELLEKNNCACEVKLVHDKTGARDVPLSTRVSEANKWDADVYLSIHHNAGVGGRAAGGTVVYYCSPKAERDVQARRLYAELIVNTRLKGNRSEPVINKGFYVLKNTKMPAFLIENGFMDSSTDVPIILSDEHARKTAEAIVEFLVDMGLDTKPNSSESPYYPKCAQSFTGIAAALTSIGVDSTYAHRAKIAAANGIEDYKGTATQNTDMLLMLKRGLLRKV